MPKRKKGQLEPVGKVLRGVYPAPDQYLSTKAFAWWNRSVPARIVEQARPVKLVHGTLIVHVSSSVWANELHYLSADLLAELHKHAPDSGVKRLKFKVGPLPHLPKPPAPARRAPEPVRLAALPEALGRALANIGDDELRKAVTDAATTSLSRRKPD
ncbi:MAG: DUF721 domain-containing protein [Myxococcota bacterium]